MLKNFIKVVLRNLGNRGLYSFINISGLAIGIICSLLIMIWVMDEYSFNKFLPKYERLHQVWINADLDVSIQSWTTTPAPLYKVLKTADHRVENVTITGSGSEHVIKFGETRISKEGRYVSEEFLEMFEFPLISGEADVVLDETYSIVLTESTAKALFGDESAINKIVKLDNQHSLTVTGVLKDVPENSTIQFDYLLTWRFAELTNSLVHFSKQDWSSNLFYIFMEVKEGNSHEEVSKAIEDAIAENYSGNFEQKLFLYPMERWRLYSHFEDGKESGDGLIEYINLFMIIAALVLIIAGVNFTNLMTAQSEKSSREVGIRKTLGASRSNLVGRFLGESFIATIIAFIIALVITFLVLPYFGDLVEKELTLDLTSGTFWLISLGILFFTALISGSYPAFYLSAVNPLITMKGKVANGKGTFRKALTIMQLGTAILLLTGTLVIYQQIKMMKDRDLGYLKDRLVTIKYNNEMRQNYNVIKQQLLQSGAIETMTRSSSPITNIAHNNLIEWPGKLPDQRVMFATITSEYDYAKTMGIEMIEGRDFSREHPSDSSGIIFNKAAMEVMKLKAPIGTQFNLWGRKKHLIGVIDNVVMEDLEQVIRPLFIIFEDWGGTVTVRLSKQMDTQS
ncbi:MAG: ABC transporter permease, partial [Cyclobacteriaceae bacterium]